MFPPQVAPMFWGTSTLVSRAQCDGAITNPGAAMSSRDGGGRPGKAGMSYPTGGENEWRWANELLNKGQLMGLLFCTRDPGHTLQ